MLGVTLFGLFLTPVFYVVLRMLEQRLTGRVRPVNHRPTLSAPHIAAETTIPAEV